MRDLPVRRATAPQLVGDLPGLGVAPVVPLGRLLLGQRHQRRPRELLVERERLDAVIRLSRPKSVMNHGRPPPGIAQGIVTLSGRIRSAARSSMLWR